MESLFEYDNCRRDKTRLAGCSWLELTAFQIRQKFLARAGVRWRLREHLGFLELSVNHSFDLLQWFEIQKKNSLAIPIVPCAVWHPHKLRACPRCAICAK